MSRQKIIFYIPPTMATDLVSTVMLLLLAIAVCSVCACKLVGKTPRQEADKLYMHAMSTCILLDIGHGKSGIECIKSCRFILILPVRETPCPVVIRKTHTIGIHCRADCPEWPLITSDILVHFPNGHVGISHIIYRVPRRRSLVQCPSPI